MARKTPSKRSVEDGIAKKHKTSTIDNAGFPIVALGASAGGLEAFETFFKAASHDTGIAFVLLAHLDPTHVSLLPELIQKHTKMPVHQIQDGMKVQRNHVYVIPPNKNLSILNGTLQLIDLTLPRGFNLPIDSFFRTLAQDQGANAVCIILSGTGTDGTLGLKAIMGEVGMVMVQDEESAKYDGMPRSAISTGLADYVLSPDKMPEQLIKYTRHTLQISTPDNSAFKDKTSNALQKIYIILREQTKHDFSLYKQNTICRRIERRMKVNQIENIADYAHYIQESTREVDILFKELLIGVTNFFRDALAFETLQNTILPELLNTKPDDYTIRVWVAGCSTGEEAYSLAIILRECMETMKRQFNVQIFGTDIDEDAIMVARAGRYPESILADVSPERLNHHFTKEEDGRYRIKKSIREMLVFAPQDVIKDPPFTKLDILSCRNLLIYLSPELQRKLLPVFHYSLRPQGILFLGSSETIGQSTDLFSMLNKKWKIFRRQFSDLATHPDMAFHGGPSTSERTELEIPESIRKSEEISSLQLVETILQQSNTAPCAIIDDTCNVIYIHGRTGRFLEPAEGKASVNILEMARPGLKSDLAAAIRKVAIQKQEVVHRGLRVEDKSGDLSLDLSVKPIIELGIMRGLMMVTFEEVEKPSNKNKGKPAIVARSSKGRSVEELSQELQYTKENLKTTIEELETSNEELKSTNEELQSTNEELQSTNEEMETSKEELQSLNEETTTVNTELQSRIDELSKTNDDMKNFLDSADIATLFLDMDLCIRRFTPTTTNIIPLAGTDSGRPVKHFATSLINVDLEEYSEKVLKDLVIRETEVTSRYGQTYTMKLRPYRTSNNMIDGVVITFDDISERRKAEDKRQETEKYFRSYFDLGFIGMAMTSQEEDWVHINDSLCEIMGYSRNELSKLTWAEITHPDDLNADAAEFNRMLAGELEGYNVDKRLIRKNGDIIYASISIKCVRHEDSTINHFIILVQDITERRLVQEILGESELRFRILFELASDSIVLINAKTGNIEEFNRKAHEHLGYTRDEFAQLKLTDIEAEESTSDVTKRMKKIFKQ